jgi:2-keto-4-pentenoate hydratase/2-oxohepta-3-ene-1,7-dioic acid hydratase in catechol pathway
MTVNVRWRRHDREPLGAPIEKPEKIICVGLNYHDRVRETGATVPVESILFTKVPHCMVGPHDEIQVPRGSLKTDWEVELGVVIGQRARYLSSPDAAIEVIAGYATSHDVSARVPDRTRRPVGQGPGLRDVQPPRPLARDARRGPRPPGAGSAPLGERRRAPERLDGRHGL